MHEFVSHLFQPDILYTIFTYMAVLSTVVIIFVILLENRNPVKSLGWVTILLLLPVFGIILYIFFGRNIKNTRMISRRNRRRLRKSEKRVPSKTKEVPISPNSLQQVNLARSLTGAQLYCDNSVEVFTNGKEKIKALKKDLREAKVSIHLQYYIYEDDELGREIAQILREKVKEGVKVRIIYDHVGSFNVSSKFFKELRRDGIEIYPFFRVSFPKLATRVNWRNHRKICVIDNVVGYLGGMNIAQRYIDGGKYFKTWRDTHVRVVGPVVAALNYSFAVDWSFMDRELLDDGVPSNAMTPASHPNACTDVAAQLLTSGPTSQWANIAMAFHKAIANARRRVYIQTPYFLPTEALLKVLQAASLAHVDVRIMMPRHADSKMLTLASNSYIRECLRAGIKIYLYEPGMLHSKMMIVDDEIVTIGSTNFDFRSFECNFESNLFFFSRQLTEKCLEDFRRDLTHCHRITTAEWRKRPLKKRISESIVRLLSPVL